MGAEGAEGTGWGEEPLPLVIGAGPGGVSAALWLHAAGQRLRWVDAAGVGGALARVHHPLRNVPGQVWKDGAALGDALRAQSLAVGLGLPWAARARRVCLATQTVTLDVQGDAAQGAQVVPFSHLILATGTRPRLPDAAALGIAPAEALDRALFLSTTRWAARFAGQPVALLGGGDGALEGALILARHGAGPVHIVHRGGAYRARPDFVEAARAHPAISLHPHSAPTRLHLRPDGGAAALDVRGPDGLRQLPIAGLFIKLGVAPALPLIEPADALAAAPDGYLLTDAEGRTAHPRVWAAGDVRRPRLQCVATAWGDGAAAAAAVLEDIDRARAGRASAAVDVINPDGPLR